MLLGTVPYVGVGSVTLVRSGNSPTGGSKE